MANTKDFIVKNAVEVGGDTKVTVGDAASAGSYTVGYDISAASYSSKFGDTSSETNEISGIYIKPDGTKMYVSDIDTDKVYQYSLSTAWDASTATYDSKSISTLSQHGYPNGIYFKSDGTKFYMIDSATSVYQYSLSTAWDVSTASYDSVSYNYDNDVNISGRDIFFKSDGLRMYLLGTGNYDILSYTLSTAWDLSTASFDGTSACLDITNTVDAFPTGLYISDDGYALFIIGTALDLVTKITLSTAWDVSTGDIGNRTNFSVSSEMTFPNGMTMGDNGAKLYVLNSASGTSEGVYQYSTGSPVTTGSFDLSTGNYFTDTPSADVEYTFSNSGDVQSFQLEVTGNSAGFGITDLSYDSKSADVSSQIAYAAGVAFKTDGTKMYVTSAASTGSGDVFQYTLSTAWDVSTASYDSVSYSNGSITNGYGLQFKSDGTRLYIQAYEDDRVYEHTLSTAWDLSTTSATGNSLYYGSQTASAYDFTISSDGTKIYVSNNDSPMYQYTMSTAWDISTASYDSVTFAVSGQTPDDGWYVQFNSDGTKMFGVNADDIYQYSLSTAWDLSTASYDSVSNIGGLSAATDTGNFVFKSDGTKLYQARTGNVYQYTSSSAITVTWDEDIAWPSGTAPNSPAAGEKDIYTFMTDDTGTSYIGFQSGDAFS